VGLDFAARELLGQVRSEIVIQGNHSSFTATLLKVQSSISVLLHLSYLFFLAT
jgi:hypothetical protein